VDDVPSSRRPRLRRLSAEEIELWLNVTRNVVRRPGSRLPERVAPPAKTKLELYPDGNKGMSEALSSLPEGSRPAAAVSAPPPLAPLERRLRQKLARGRAAPEASIDLHGMRRQEAFIALREFLLRAQLEGARLVLVVTGKGGRSPSGDGTPGVLRTSVPNWLREPLYHAVVLGFEEAQRPHGGSGAFYVRLRRRDRAMRGGAP